MDYVFIGFAIAVGFYFAPVMLITLTWITLVIISGIQELIKAIWEKFNE